MAADVPATLGEAAGFAQRMLRAAGIEDAGRDARLLVAAAAGSTTAEIISHPERPLSDDMRSRIASMLERRSSHEPVSRILGEREFYGRRFLLSPATLDPRPDTETLIDAALAIADQAGWRQKPIRILDVGTGTGCILITLLAELPLASGVGTDVSSEALAMAATNAAEVGVDARASFERRDVLEGVDGQFDLVVSNPPYIPTVDIAGLEPDVRDFDPHTALDGGADGLDIYRRLAAGLDKTLAPGGAVVVEVGAGQAEAVAMVFQQAFVKTRLPEVSQHTDLGGHTRCVALRLQL